MPFFRKKPVVIEANLFDGTGTAARGLARWSEGRVQLLPGENRVAVETLEGTMRADVGDWILRGVNGEFYPCKPDIFEKTYDRVED